MSTNKPPSLPAAIDRTERRWLVGAILLGAILRLGYPGRMAIEHFDEGVYASNFWFGGNPYPAQYLYAPPLLPAAIEWTMILAALIGVKPTGFIPMIPCLIAGIAMIPSIWWVCRRWFGPVAGLVSAWLVATSDFHICYSRAALTDVPVCLFILWAVYFIWSAFSKIHASAPQVVERARTQTKTNSRLPWKDILLAGGFTGLAWWTKYNGWLPLAIGVAGGVFWQWLVPVAERRISRIVLCWLSICLVAFLTWSPVLWGLQDDKIGGYSAVAANHRQYVVGIKGWANSAWTQLNNLGMYENPLDALYAPFSEHLLPTLTDLNDSEANLRTKTKSVYEFLFRGLTPVLFPTLGCVISLWVSFHFTVGKQSSNQLIAACLVAAWFGGMTVATPCYFPYPRLVFPWLCAVWICLGLFANSFQVDGTDRQLPRFQVRSIYSLFVLLCLISLVRTVTGSAFAWQDRSDLQTVSAQIVKAVREDVTRRGKHETETTIYVFAEPAIVFGANAEGKSTAVPARDLEFIDVKTDAPTFLAIGTNEMSLLTPKDHDRITSIEHQKIFEVRPNRSHLVLNDSRRTNGGTDMISLYQITR